MAQTHWVIRHSHGTKWAAAQTLAGFRIELDKGPSSEDLKSPVLWLSHAHAMSEAARILLEGVPNLELMPEAVRGACHCQYHAVALMLVGYSLEVCLKAMLLVKNGVAFYRLEEKKHHHHNLDKLTDFIPNLSEKDLATLRGLSHFVRWAGRYPDPGFGKENKAEEIFQVSERYRVSAKDLFQLASRIMGHSREVLEER